MKDFHMFCKFNLLSFFLLTVLMTSCGQSDSEYAKYVQFDSGSLQKGEWHTINFENRGYENQNDTIAESYPAEVWINVRYSPDFRYNSLHLEIEETSNNTDSILFSKIEIPLFDSEGKPFSKSSHKVLESSYKIHDSLYLEMPYNLSFSPLSEDNKGIISIGVTLKKIQ